MANDDDAAVLSDVDEDPLPPPPAPAHKTLPAQAPPQPDFAQAQQQRLQDLAAELEEERRLRRAAEGSLAESESRLARLKAFAQDVVRKRDELTAEAAASARSLAALQAESAASARSLAALQAEASTASSMLSSGLERISAKASPSSAPAPLPTSQKYSSGLPALAYGVLKRANDIVDDLLAQIDAANRDRDRAREQMEHRNYQIAIEVSELEASLASRSAECESLSKSLSQREAEISELRDKIASLEGKLDAQRPVLAEQIGCASKRYDEMREVVKLVDADAASALSDSVFVWKETDVEESLKVSLEGTKLAYDLAAMALEKVGACIDDKESKLRDLEDRVDELIKEKEHIGVLLRSALQATTSEVLKVAEDGLREAGIEIGLDERKEHRPGSVEKDEVYTLAGALENTMKESQIKIVELQHLVEALRAESGLLRTRLEGQEKEIIQLRKQIKHLEEKERVANESVEGLMMDVTAAEEEIKRWKMAAEEEAEAGKSIEQEFEIQVPMMAVANGVVGASAKKPLFSFGVIADVQYADIPDGRSFLGVPRYYRHSISVLQRAVSRWNKHGNIKFSINFGDIIDGYCPKDKSLWAVQKVLDEFDKFDGPTYHMFGNHCLYNLPRSKLVSLLKMPTDSDRAYYDFSPCSEFRIVVLDAYDFSCLGWPHDHPVTAAAMKLLDEKNPNTDKNSPGGLVGVDRRFVKFNGAVGKEQLSWLNDVLQDASTLHQNAIICSHLPMDPGASSPAALMWNYDEVMAIVRQYDCVKACFAGHDHKGGHSVDSHGVHHHTLEAALECPPGTSAFGHVEVYPDRLLLVGSDRMADTEICF